jgi:cell division protein FtsN
MQRRPPPRRPFRSSPRSGAGGTLFGIFIGIIVGLGLAAGVAFWLIRNNPPAPSAAAGKDSGPAVAAGKSATSDKPRFDFYKILPGVEEPKIQTERKADRTGDRAVAEQSRESGATPRAVPAPVPAPGSSPPASNADKVATAEPPAKAQKAGERYWLQAGSFSAQSDAENLKARLALGGWEANVQEGTLPDKGVRYRVRLGPYDDADELGRMKAELARRGFDVAVIRY